MEYLIFLDYDGVVNSLWFENPMERPFFNYSVDNKVNNTQAIGWLNFLYTRFKYKIVVTSTWRYNDNYKECLYNAGLNPEIEILGCTPKEDGCRGDEILMWLFENMEISYNNIELPSNIKIAILDDDNDMGILSPYLIQTDNIIGLTYYDYIKIKEKWEEEN